MFVIAGLGNPGLSYRKTRHNIGFMALDVIAERIGVKIKDKKFSGLLGEGELNGERVILVKPQTYMNLSGDAVQPAAAFYKIPTDHIIVVHDDMGLHEGKLLIKRGGSDGGHNGIKSITQRLGSPDYPRVKIGVGQPPNPEWDRIDWVIGKLTDEEYKIISEAAQRAVKAVEELLHSGIDSAMNKYNR